ncbi:hypothetical protein [Methylocystis heyeri]|uniref:Uncharacterized protein n=1 Tax=Methylocystis heyeri TaxID=391905 RepID=A0A6B8KIQ2_9HYPH|nr:hypothetical protein [Methylocystis heyeri]QGM48266.1 hypothetical protein H2LOC_020995 [Methylocystis heyeri]
MKRPWRRIPPSPANDPSMAATAQKMRAEGLKIELQDGKEDNGRTHRCVAVRPGMSVFGTAEAPFCVLKGY